MASMLSSPCIYTCQQLRSPRLSQSSRFSTTLVGLFTWSIYSEQMEMIQTHCLDKPYQNPLNLPNPLIHVKQAADSPPGWSII